LSLRATASCSREWASLFSPRRAHGWRPSTPARSGFDIYTRAVSDAYQDLFGEGSFTGKGIYEVAVFHAVLERRFPRNALLSHDLIEGAYTRAGLATDIELIDDYPSHYSAYTRRKHRWVRGDWQIVQWMFPRVPEESGHLGTQPDLCDLPLEDLRQPAPFSGGALHLHSVRCRLARPAGRSALLDHCSAPLAHFSGFRRARLRPWRRFVSDKQGRVSEAFSGFWTELLVALLNLIFLPHQTLLSLDAIVRSLVRRFITGKRLLEWETAAQTESQSSSRTPVDRYLALIPYVAFGLAILVYFFAPQRDAIFVRRAHPPALGP
jgi:cyclic beta-1,2-glucan synthetase